MKDEILQTSLKQFLKYGIRKISIQKLIEPLGISTKTVYKYFRNKEELLDEVLQLYFARQYELFEEVAGQNAVTLLFDVWNKGIENEMKTNKVFFDDLHRFYPELEAKIDAINGSRFWQQFIRIIERGIEEGIIRNDTIPDVALEGIAVLYLSITRKAQFKKFRIPPQAVVLNTIAPYVRGLCTAKGLAILDGHILACGATVKTNVAKTKKAVPVTVN